LEFGMAKRYFGNASCAVVAAFGLSACGGGGGGGIGSIPAPPMNSPLPAPAPAPSPTPTPTAQTNVDYNTSEYRSSNYAVAANAITAYQNGATGQGVKIAVIDTGINPNLREFAGKIDSASADVAGNRGVSDEDGHGTAVSAVAAASRNNAGTHGVAFDSSIISLRADTPGSCATTGDDGGCQFSDANVAIAVDRARTAGARVINLSMGGGAPNSTFMAAVSRAVNAGIVVVISAGNDGEKPEGSNPDAFALTPAQRFPGQVIIAGSVGVAGTNGIDTSQISTFSNRAGTGSQYYLTALGYRDRAPDHEGTFYGWSGTSFSAPTISGAAALLAQAFPNLSGSQIIDILFRSADDLGAAGTDAVFGRGRLDIAAAFTPIGKTSVAGTSTPISTGTNGSLPAAAGDAGSQSSAGIIILDGYSRAFAIRLGATLREAERQQPLMQGLGGNVRVAGGAAGPVSIAMSVSERRDLPSGFAAERMNIGPEDARRARMVAASAIARLNAETAAAFGIKESAKSLERRLAGAEAGAFLIAKDAGTDTGFLAKRDTSIAVRHTVGGFGLTGSAERGTVWQSFTDSLANDADYRWMSFALDRRIGGNRVVGSVSRLDEERTLLGGRLDPALGGGRSNSMFLDLEASRPMGAGWSMGLTARRGWTSFSGGKLLTSAYGFDVGKLNLFSQGDRLGFRLSQPLRVESGGMSMLLPTAYDYSTLAATNSRTSLSFVPSGGEFNAEVSYGSWLGPRTWIGGNIFHRRQPGHVVGADADTGAAVRLASRF
jgi:subtilisin family serine protease